MKRLFRWLIKGIEKRLLFETEKDLREAFFLRCKKLSITKEQGERIYKICNFLNEKPEDLLLGLAWKSYLILDGFGVSMEKLKEIENDDVNFVDSVLNHIEVFNNRFYSK